MDKVFIYIFSINKPQLESEEVVRQYIKTENLDVTDVTLVIFTTEQRAIIYLKRKIPIQRNHHLDKRHIRFSYD
ncbi:hypothetical protein KHA80_01155 [Anaerobacillus sp. HL2]|nr:hypothetical protein KHA80_01155 [Anaerobacillus sp. HL2]